MMPGHSLWWVAHFVKYGTRRVRWIDRARIGLRIARALRHNRGLSASSLGEQLTVVNAVLDVPREIPGAVAEFGCYKGMASVALSIAAMHAGRKLIVFDSFAGLPEPKDRVTHITDGGTVTYAKGDYAGSLDEVRGLIQNFGEIGCVEFVPGFFCDTLPNRPVGEKFVTIFEDADLVESVRDVLRYAWPKLRTGGLFFSHEALDLEVVKLFFDDALWREMHGVAPPGFAGSGVGLPIDEGNRGCERLAVRRGSYLGFARKR